MEVPTTVVKELCEEEVQESRPVQEVFLDYLSPGQQGEGYGSPRL